jgi:hypothetical protein
MPSNNADACSWLSSPSLPVRTGFSAAEVSGMGAFPFASVAGKVRRVGFVFLYVEAGRSAGKLAGRAKRVAFAQRVAAVDAQNAGAFWVPSALRAPAQLSSGVGL